MDKQDTKLIPLAQAAKLTNYSQEYISLLCRRGKMKGKKIGRNWLTTKEWVDDYINKTDGSGEIIIPVRIKNETESSKAAKISENQKDNTTKQDLVFGRSFLLIKKLMLAVIICGIFLSGFVFLRQGIWNEAIKTVHYYASNILQQQTPQPSNNTIRSAQNREEILPSSLSAGDKEDSLSNAPSAHQLKQSEVAGVSDENNNEKQETIYSQLLDFFNKIFRLENKPTTAEPENIKETVMDKTLLN